MKEINIKFRNSDEPENKPKEEKKEIKNDIDIDFDFENKIIGFYKNFDINLTIDKKIESYAIDRYFAKLERTNKKKLKDVEKLMNDLCLELAIDKINLTFENGYLVFEIPRKSKKTLYFDDVKVDIDNTKPGLNVFLGKDLNNSDYIIDITKTPHLLISGTTGSGKSVLINTILVNLINTYSKEQLKISLIDPKRVELSIYKTIEQVTDFADNLEKAKLILQNALVETEKRYKILEQSGFRNIANYNANTTNKLNYKLIVIDELADILLQDKKNHKRGSKEPTLENLIVRIAQIGRAAGVHLIVATQRPSSDVITGLIKANIPSRIALSVSSATDSRVILDIKGAEKLTGNGDLYYKAVGSDELVRLQGAYLSDEAIEKFIHTRVQKQIAEKQKRYQLYIEIKEQEEIKLKADIKEMKKHPFKNYQKIKAYELSFDKILEERTQIQLNNAKKV